MSNISKEEILKLVKEISLDKDESIFSSDLIEDIVIKEGHIQISIFANRDNFQILEKVGKKIEKTLKKSINALSITSVLTNHIESNQVDQKDFNKYLNLDTSGSNFLKNCKKPELIFHEVSKEVNKPTNNYVSLIQMVN